MPNPVAIKTMFNNISGSYDLLNDILSLGIHRLWKKELAKTMTSHRPDSILDCATGTGDIAINMKKIAPYSEVYGVDFSANMLEYAKQKTTAINWSVQDVMHMPFSDKKFSATSISYGIRNVDDYHIALKEMARVTRDKICILEFGQPENRIFKCIYFAIMTIFIPLIGKLFRKQAAYKYLIDSSMAFPSGDKFARIIKEDTGFKHVEYRPLFGGVTYLYIASNLNE